MLFSIVCRSFQGIGGAGLYSLTTICLPEIGPADKPEAIGKTIGITLSLSFVLGPVLGGFIPQVSSWRVIYWLKYDGDPVSHQLPKRCTDIVFS